MTYHFHSFPGNFAPISPTDSFEEGWNSFLQEWKDSVVDSKTFSTRCVYLEHDGCSIPLYFIEQNMEGKVDFSELCIACMDWDQYSIDSVKKYHVIVPREDIDLKELSDDFLGMNSHILHGILHSNRDGHLVCINGFDGGSKYITGRDMMDFWDRICKHLKARKVMVIDSSIKRKIELRLIFGIGFRQSWFGRWNYRFPQESFKPSTITEERYNTAVEEIGSLQLNKLLLDSRGQQFHQKLEKIIDYYGNKCDIRLTTLQNLFSYILRSRHPRKPTIKDVISKSSKDGAKMNQASNFIIEVLKENQKMDSKHLIDVAVSGGLSQNTVVGFLSLIDAVTVDDSLVVRTTSPVTTIYEYTLYPLETMQYDHHVALEVPAGIDAYSDLISVYKAVRSTYEESHPMRNAIKTILDAKDLSKRYEG